MAAKQASNPIPLQLPMSPGLRRFLYVTATLTGAAVLVVEILGAKMLTPWFGSSHFVWTAQITITLLALACGYYLGGWAVDRSRRLSLIYGGLILAACYLALTITVSNKLAAACLDLNLALGSIVASLLLFFVPLTLLAAVGPFFVRMLTTSVEGVGRAVGRLSFLGTIGSVLGVLLTSYVLVPYCRNSVAMLGTAGALVLLSAFYFAVWGLGERGGGSVVAGAAAVAVFGFVALRREGESTMNHHVEVARANSHFGSMQVLEARDGRRRYYLNDFLVQNTYDPVDRRSLSMFTYALFHLADGYTPALRKALCIGLGVGIVPRTLAAHGASVDVVEINPAVVPLAKRWFDFDPSAVNLLIDDARHFVRVSTNRYDTIVLDAFLGDSSPSHLMTREAFSEIQRLLNPEGSLVINAFADFDAKRDFFGTSLYRTLKAVFREVRVHVSPGGNTFFVGSDRSPLVFRPPAGFDHVAPWCRGELQVALSAPTSVNEDRGLVLTDDYNPVDYFDAQNRERTRRILAAGASAW
ncbi:MAG: fused MFS/spermidine synthase [Verrucomicrobiales bacterium]|nr:fused MFS/spermidine synthase [Verrucomicrobiales bacterium]